MISQNRYLRLGGLVFLSSGISLLIYFLTGISILLTFIVLAGIFTIIGVYKMKKLLPNQKQELKKRIVIGIICGIVATLLYDVTRLLLIKITGMQFWPFDIFQIFGRAILGDNFSKMMTEGVGLIYHVINGTFFAIAFCLWFCKKGITYGIMYALALEALMVLVYPTFLKIKFIDEFIQVSILGHLVYGSALGVLARYLYFRKSSK